MSMWEKFHVIISIHTHGKSCNVQLPKNDFYQNWSAIKCCCITAASLLICIIYVTCIIKMLIFSTIDPCSVSKKNVIDQYIPYTFPYLRKCSYMYSKILAFLWLHNVAHLHNLCKLHNLLIFTFAYFVWVRGGNFMSISLFILTESHAMCNCLKMILIIIAVRLCAAILLLHHCSFA